MRDLLFAKLQQICGPRVTQDDEILETYSTDFSLGPSRRPGYVAFPETTEQVQGIVRAAVRHRVPVVPKSSGWGFHGGAIPGEGGILVDLQRMNRILEIDERNRMARIEPGVTYGSLQQVLRPLRLRALNPLLPHHGQSVLTSHLERDPMLIPKYEYGDPVLTLEIVLPTGKVFRTGSAAAPGVPDDTLVDLVGPHGPGLDFNKIFQGAQGTFGIVTWMSIKTEFLPRIQKLHFIPFDHLHEAVGPLSHIQRSMLGNECFLLNRISFILILSRGKKENYDSLKRTLPPWTMILCLAGGERRPEEKIAYEEEALNEIASRFNLDRSYRPALEQEKWVEEKLREPWPDDLPYWRFGEKGGGRTVSFHTTLDRVSSIDGAIQDEFSRAGTMGCYIQPLERGRAGYVEYGIPCDPSDAKEIGQVEGWERRLNESLYRQGAFFARPHGIQAQIAYERNTAYTTTLRELKRIFDPQQIMNPGKLCF